MFTLEQINQFQQEMKQYRQENCHEEPGDNFFYGELMEKVETKEKLLELMIKGVLKYMLCYNLRKHQISQGLDFLDSAFEHDHLRENYFDFLLPNEEAREFFGQVEEGVLENFPAFTEIITPSQVEQFKKEIAENFEESGNEIPADSFFYGHLSARVKSLDQLVEIMTYAVLKYMLCFDLGKEQIEKGLDMLNTFIEHDSDLELHYFVFLIPNNGTEIFNRVKEGVLKNL